VIATNYQGSTLPSTCTDPFYGCGWDSVTGTGGNVCHCPNCGYWHAQQPVTQTFYIPAQPREPEPPEDLKAALKAWHKALSRQAAWEASVALRGDGKERRGPVSLQAQQRPYVRPTSKKRVCGGSSRYRVRVN